jgi:hypothetical protein
LSFVNRNQDLPPARSIGHDSGLNYGASFMADTTEQIINRQSLAEADPPPGVSHCPHVHQQRLDEEKGRALDVIMLGLQWRTG